MTREEVAFWQIGELLDRTRTLSILIPEPDGDALGAALAFRLAMVGRGCEVFLASAREPPTNLSFLPGFETIERTCENPDGLVATFDCPHPKLLGFDHVEIDMVIDHHSTGINFARLINFRDPEAAAVCEIIERLFRFLGIPIDRKIATCLLTGIITDTGFFQHQNTTDTVLEAAARLVATGARPAAIAQHTDTFRSIATLHLWGRALARLWRHPDGIYLTVLSRRDLAEVGAREEDLEGVANFLNVIPEARALLILSERGGEVRGNIRTRAADVDVGRLARLFRGGGHAKAAGFSLKGRLVERGGVWQIDSLGRWRNRQTQGT